MPSSETLPPEDSYLVAPQRLRAAAWTVDCFLLLILIATLPQPLRFLIPLGLFILYHTILVYFTQQTVGKALFGLRVERIGGTPSFLWALGRSSVGYLVIDVFGLGVVLALFNRRHLCAHDYVFGSAVVFQGPKAMKAKRMVDRLLEFGEKQAAAVAEKTAAVAEKKKPITVLAALWAFLTGLARWAQKATDSLAGGSAVSEPAVISVLSGKAGLAVAATTSALSGALVMNVPVVQ